MKRRLFGILSTVVLMTLTFTIPALGQEGELEPAVPVEPPPDTETLLEWTYRFLIPTALLLGVAVIVITSIRYFTNVVRKRYRIVEE